MSAHPDDEVYVASLTFAMPRMQQYCGSCTQRRRTAVIGWIDACSGAGYDIRWCRDCIIRRRARRRARLRILTAGRGTLRSALTGRG